MVGVDKLNTQAIRRYYLNKNGRLSAQDCPPGFKHNAVMMRLPEFHARALAGCIPAEPVTSRLQCKDRH